KVSQPEVLRNASVLVVWSDFDKPVGVLVGFRSETSLFRRPVAKAVAIQPGANFLAERAHGEDGLGVGGRALNGGVGDGGSRERCERYPILRHHEAGKHFTAQAAALVSGGSGDVFLVGSGHAVRAGATRCRSRG